MRDQGSLLETTKSQFYQFIMSNFSCSIRSRVLNTHEIGAGLLVE
jgi:hypothetical protein